jgi:thiol:disulfide interchange protein DsbD
LTFSGQSRFLTYDLVLGIYVALALLCGLYLLNLYRLPHDHEHLEHLGVPRLMFSLLFLSLAFYLLPGLFKSGGEQQRPTGTVFAWLDSFLLPDAPEGEGEPGARGAVARGKEAARLNWVGNLDQGLRRATDRKELVFVDFTGLA